MTARVELLSAFACEDVRLEFNGQMTFVGTVSSRFGAEAFPTKMPLHIVTMAKVSGEGLAEIEFQTVLNEKEVLTSALLGVEIHVDDDSAIFPLGPIFGMFPNPGQVALNWKIKEEDHWRLLKVWHIEQVKPTSEADVPST
jgi:hypothetical protein